MTTNFTDVFGGQTVPPANESYVAYTITADSELVWPFNYNGANLLLGDITEFSASAGLSVKLPPANLSSVGSNFIVRNTGANSFALTDNTGNAVTTVDAGTTKFLYTTDNTTVAGVWSVFTYGTGTSGADATLLAGAGVQASANKLQLYSDYFTVNANYNIVSSDRARLLDVVSGTNTISLPQSSSVGIGFYIYIRNSSTGNVQVDGYSSETIDGSSAKNMAPAESAIFVCNGTAWVTVGYGRSSTFTFSELVLNAAVPSITLTSASVAGRMIRVTGTATQNVIVTLPSVNNIYFVNVESGLGIYSITFKTASVGGTVVLNANQSTVLYCDGTNVSTGINFIQASSVSLDDGSPASPSIRFNLNLNTGFYRNGTGIIGVASNGNPLLTFQPTAIVPGTNNTLDLGTNASSFKDIYAVGTGSSIGWIRAAAGAVATKIGTWMGWQEPSVFDFMTVVQIADVMAGTLAYDTVPAFNSALASGRPVKVHQGTGWKYRLDSTLSIPSGASLKSNGAYLRLSSGVNSHVMRIANGADNVEIEGFEIDGNKAGNTGGNGIATGGTGCTNVRIRGNRIHDCSGSGVYIDGTTVTGIQVSGNFTWGNAAAGITGNSVDKFAFDNNFSWLNGTHGIGLIGIGTNGSVSNNVAWDNGQGTPTADNITAYNPSIYNVKFVGNVTSGGLNNGMHYGGSRIVVSGNTTAGAANYGLAVWPSSGSGDDVVVTNNLNYGNGLAGIWVQNCNSGIISNNLSRNNGAQGIALDNCTDVAITGNTLRGNTQDGIRNGTASLSLTITGNVIRSNGGDGIDLNNVTESVVSSNSVRINAGYGINVGGTEANNVISANKVKSNTAGQIVAPAVSTRVWNNETGESANVASAATVTLPPNGEYFYITGTTGITSITAGFRGRRVTFQFDDALTMTDGSNLRLAGNFTTAFMRTITLISDGTNWVECSRSNN